MAAEIEVTPIPKSTTAFGPSDIWVQPDESGVRVLRVFMHHPKGGILRGKAAGPKNTDIAYTSSQYLSNLAQRGHLFAVVTAVKGSTKQLMHTLSRSHLRYVQAAPFQRPAAEYAATTPPKPKKSKKTAGKKTPEALPAWMQPQGLTWQHDTASLDEVFGPGHGYSGKGKGKQSWGPTPSFGGVVIDDSGSVLLRAPKNFFGGYAWTHAKGGIDKGETPEEAALREVREETGFEALILGEIDQEWPGTTTVTRYFLMRPIEQVQQPDHETYRVAWFPIEEARERIKDTQNAKGRERDLEALDAAWTLWMALRGGKKNPRSRRSRGR